ncbi:hypothetical protein [Nostoc sp. LPT]|uniref:hypothetical protein n=1 Tax=Nostoc sp. LPT TaxID=2815387 RepID=UPI001D479CD5|nr:hypothetical protein [Nostoc sp. LPT]MBN4006762.1 hypothetical protein [Nostoc sp. LPT]
MQTAIAPNYTVRILVKPNNNQGFLVLGFVPTNATCFLAGVQVGKPQGRTGSPLYPNTVQLRRFIC